MGHVHLRIAVLPEKKENLIVHVIHLIIHLKQIVHIHFMQHQMNKLLLFLIILKLKQIMQMQQVVPMGMFLLTIFNWTKKKKHFFFL